VAETGTARLRASCQPRLLVGAPGRERSAARSFAGAHSLATPLSALQARVPAGSLPAEGPARAAGRTVDYFRAAHEASRPGHQGRLVPPPSVQMKSARHHLTSACTRRGAAVGFLEATTACPALARSGDLAAAPQVMRSR
jgi:hypothetical protein